MKANLTKKYEFIDNEWQCVQDFSDCAPLECRVNTLRWQEMGLQYTASGYGSKIPTHYQVKHNNRWKRVYCRIYSNIGTLYIVSGKDKLFIDIER